MKNPITEKPVRKKYWTLRILLVLAVTYVLASLIYSSGSVRMRSSKSAKLFNEVTQVQAAVTGYYTEYSAYPVAPDNASLIKKLSQDNPRRIVFLVVKASDLNANGEMMDPWGTPFRITFDPDSKVHVVSAGPDKIFGTADDISN